ncbi:hypothetical protein CMUS01_12349 [Colletotrichum musicola]|uniref:Uncharacterized protein n=1 Tax=Colletotrichum musicola TaxID=2175873 RepID=A0A8H6JMM6_9PEZI|nr:hypothetical protein CMUS01_12349 [Colletotrichum musicola]
MSNHILRGRFAPRCPDGTAVDYSTAWPLYVRIPLMAIITICFMCLHPSVNDVLKRVVWAMVKPIALLIGYVSVAFVRALIFIFIDGPEMAARLLKLTMESDEDEEDVLASLDVENNTKLNAIMGRLHATQAEDWVPGRVFDKKYKPYLVADKMNFAGPRQKKAMTRSRGSSC